MGNKLSYFEMNKNKLKVYDKEAHEKLEALINEFNRLLSKVITTDNIDQQSVLYADNSGSANSANHATTADSADSANHAKIADSATTAGSANRANHATTADSADSANHATTADSAYSATHATTADSADSATTADSANSVKWNNVKNKPSIPVLKTIVKTLNFTLNAGVRKEYDVPINLRGTLLGITVAIDNNPSWFKTELKNLSIETLTISISNEYTSELTSNCNILISYI